VDKAQILIVEDSPTQLKLLQYLLEKNGHTVTASTDGRAALALARQLPLNLIISDISMPDMDGYQLCREIRQDPRLEALPLLLLTSLSDPADVIRGLAAGANGFISKPYEEDHLLSSIDYLLVNRKLRKEGAGGDVNEVIFGQEKYVIEADRRQVLDFLLPVFATAVQKNQSLLAARNELQHLNEQLEEKVAERTALLSAEVAERKRAQEQIILQMQKLHALRDIDIAINASLDLRVSLNIFLDKLTNNLQVDAAAVLILNPVTKTLECVVERGFRTTMKNLRLYLSDSFAGRVVLDRRTLQIKNVAEVKDRLRTPLLEREDMVAYVGVPLVAKGQVKGVLEIFQRTAFSPQTEWLDFLEALAGQAAIALDNATLFDDLQKTNLELLLAYESTLEGWARTLELRDQETEGHSRRVTDLTVRIAGIMGVADKDMMHVRHGALLHDVGKIGIPDGILLKRGPLTDIEWEIMRRHTQYAYELLSPIAFLMPALDIPYCHHEKWDGSGYPRGLKGEQIPLAARIFAVVDVWDALNSDRPYRKKMNREEVLAYIQSLAGTHFDPRVVEVFLSLEDLE
jgi:response regulator RpfG family c-di-GMP phosphodiesterase